MFAEIRRIYRQSLKPADSYFNLYLARPLAAPFVALFARTRVCYSLAQIPENLEKQLDRILIQKNDVFF